MARKPNKGKAQPQPEPLSVQAAGRRGGYARALSMTADQRRASARKAGLARAAAARRREAP